MAVYISGQDITDEGGEVAALWAQQSRARKLSLIARASARIDRITGQDGGLLTQTNKTARVSPEHRTDTLTLPNSPITAVSAISVQVRGVITVLAVGAGDITITGQRITYAPANPLTIAGWHDRYEGAPGWFHEGEVVTVTYSCGYDTIPDGVKDAALRLIAHDLFMARDNPGRYERIGLDGATVQFGAAYLAEVGDLLEPYCVRLP